MSISLRKNTHRSVFALSLFAALAFASPAVRGQENSSKQTSQQQQVATTEVGAEGSTNVQPAPKFTEYNYKGIRIGMSATEVREKLDHLKEKGKTQDFFVYSDTESMQVFYDAKGKAVAISIHYIGDNSNAPTPEAVLGHAVTPKANGSVYELVRYPKAGYWIAYNRTVGSDPVITVTMQKIR